MGTARPSSSTSKSAAARSITGRPLSSVTIASTCTSVVPPRKIGGCCVGAGCCARPMTPTMASATPTSNGRGAKALAERTATPRAERSAEAFALRRSDRSIAGPTGPIAMVTSASGERDVTTPHTETAAQPLTALSEDERLFRDSVYEFADREIRPLVREMDEHAKIPAALIEKLFDLGVMGIDIPDTYGGGGATFFHSVL